MDLNSLQDPMKHSLWKLCNPDVLCSFIAREKIMYPIRSMHLPLLYLEKIDPRVDERKVRRTVYFLADCTCM